MSAGATIKIKKGSYANLTSAGVVAGEPKFCTDNGSFYVGNGTSNVFIGPYALPTASSSVLGGVKVGTNLTIADGVLSVSGLGSAAFTESSAYIAATAKGTANGVAELGSDGKVPTAQLPAYVDDVIEGYYYNNKFYADAEHTTEITGETGKIYVDLSTNKTYRWSGSTFVEISSSLALGETETTAYRGDRGAAAYAHGVTNKGAAFPSGLYKITTNSEGHVTAATAVAKSDITDLGIPAQDTTYTANNGITLSGTNFYNSGVRSIDPGSTNGTILVNTNGTSAEVAVKGLGSAAYTASSAYAAASHGNHVPTTQTASNSVFLRNDNTWATVTPANIGAAATSHGNHVPTTQTASNSVFLRNDNTWQSVTPANIGAVSTSTGVTHTQSTAAGGTTQPVYVTSSGVATAIGYTIQTSVPSGAVFTDTKNTAGLSNSTSKIYLVGGTVQTDGTQTYSNSSCYASGGYLYSNGVKAVTGVSKGSSTQPVYIDSNGLATQIGYTIQTSVPSGAVFTDTKNTAGSTDTSSKIYLVGGTAQAANIQTFSDNEVYTTSGTLRTTKLNIADGCTLQYDSTNKCLNFVFS